MDNQSYQLQQQIQQFQQNMNNLNQLINQVARSEQQNISQLQQLAQSEYRNSQELQRLQEAERNAAQRLQQVQRVFNNVNQQLNQISNMAQQVAQVQNRVGYGTQFGQVQPYGTQFTVGTTGQNYQQGMQQNQYGTVGQQYYNPFAGQEVTISGQYQPSRNIASQIYDQQRRAANNQPYYTYGGQFGTGAAGGVGAPLGQTSFSTNTENFRFGVGTQGQTSGMGMTGQNFGMQAQGFQGQNTGVGMTGQNYQQGMQQQNQYGTVGQQYYNPFAGQEVTISGQYQPSRNIASQISEQQHSSTNTNTPQFASTTPRYVAGPITRS